MGWRKWFSVKKYPDEQLTRWGDILKKSDCRVLYSPCTVGEEKQRYGSNYT